MKDQVSRLLGLANKAREKQDPVTLSEREHRALLIVTECSKWKNLDESEKDRDNLRLFLNAMTSITVREADLLSLKAVKLSEGRTLTEGMAASLAGEHGGDEKGGVDKKDEAPKGDADTGSKQDVDRGKDPKGQKGYLPEQDDEDKNGGPPPEVMAKIKAKQNGNGNDNGDNDVDEGYFGVAKVASELAEPATKKGDKDKDKKKDEAEVQKDAPDPEGERAAKDAKIKDGVKQNEAASEHGKADDPGEPVKGGSPGKKPEAEDIKDHPDYSKAKAEDPSNSELNKGPAQVSENFEDIESKVVSMLESAGFEPGSDQWKELFCKGFNRAIQERADVISSHLLAARK